MTGWALWRRQVAGILRLELKKSFFAKRGLWIYLGSPENVAMKLNGRAVVVGGSKPRSLIVTLGDIVPAAPGS